MSSKHRIALAVARGADAGKPHLRDPSGDSSPRNHVFDDAFQFTWDESILPDTGGKRLAPMWWYLAEEVQRRHGQYDGVVTWGERLSLAMLLQHQLATTHKPHIAMMYQFEKLNIRLPLSLLKRQLHAVVTWSTVQRRALIENIGYPARQVFLVRHYVDQLFYRPMPAEQTMICAVGAEMRDYVTFKKAMAGTGIRCHIAADHVRVPGLIRLLNDRRVPLDATSGADSGISQGRKTLLELRELYAQSRFVVIPLLHSDTDNGVTCILQAMAMGKAVICSKTRGQVDVIEDGVTGIYVPVGDAAALRAAIVSLWNDPARAQQMGRNARAYVEKFHSLEMFTATVRSAAAAALDGRPAPDVWWDEQ